MKHVVFCVLLLVTVPLLGEAMLRVGIAMNVPAITNPALYADAQSDNDYWKLYAEWGGRWKCTPDRVHPRLGWSQAAVTATNPLGLRSDVLQRFQAATQKILFYGDSFVNGVADDDYTLPNYLQRHLTGRDVVDLSMGGYGLDQIYLMFAETHHLVADPIILVGVLLSDDLDRTVLTVRTSTKPYFISEADGLTLKGVPITREQAVNCHGAPLKLNSYLAALVKQKVMKSDDTATMKQAISAKLFEAFKQEAGSPTFVLFYQRPHLDKQDWREPFVKNTLAQLGLRYIDTKPMLLSHANPAMLYGPDGHHNNLGNEIIGRGIVKYFHPSPSRP